MPAMLGTITPLDLMRHATRRLTGEDEYGLGTPGLGPGQAPASTPPPIVPGGGGGGGGGGGPVPPGSHLLGTLPLGAATPRWASWAPAAPQAPIEDIIAKAMQNRNLGPDPQLPTMPMGAYTDSQFEAENAVLMQQINAAYQDILEQTGYDVGGKHFPGLVEMGAARKERDYLTGLVQAADEVTGRMQQAGTIFSGYHAGQRAQAEQPFVTGLGDLAVDTPRTLSKLYENASDLMREFVVQRNMLLQQAAWRQAQALAQAQGQAPPPPPPGGGGPSITPNPLPDLTWLDPTVTNPPYQEPTGPGSWYGGEYQHPGPKKKKPQEEGYYVGGRY